MTELLFILTTIFVAYVIYAVVSEQKTSSPSEKSDETTLPIVRQDPPPPAVVRPAAPTVAAKPAQPVPAAAPVEEPAVSPAAEAAAPSPPEIDKSRRGIKNPKTGEVILNYTNYRFAKRWLKEALVEEGLVDRIYKSDEITPDVEARIKAAVAQMETMAKYQP